MDQPNDHQTCHRRSARATMTSTHHQPSGTKQAHGAASPNVASFSIIQASTLKPCARNAAAGLCKNPSLVRCIIWHIVCNTVVVIDVPLSLCCALCSRGVYRTHIFSISSRCGAAACTHSEGRAAAVALTNLRCLGVLKCVDTYGSVAHLV